jgi:electron transport complex protein RnfE
MNLGKQFKEGLITNNPVLVQVLGMCSTMAISTSFFNGLGMGVAVLVILTLSNIIISAIRKIVPDKIRIAMFIVVIAGFVTMVDLMIQAFLPDLSKSLGVFIPLIVVNCIILARAEGFCYKNGVLASFWDGIFQGIGYTVVLLIISIVRELVGAGTFGGGLLNGGDGIRIIPEQYPISVLTLPAGGFLVLGTLIAIMQWALNKSKTKEESK